MYASKDEYYYYRDLVYGQNFYGDPTVRIYLDEPQPLAIAVSKSAYPVVTVTSAGHPVAGIEVTVSDSTGVVGSLITDESGQATVGFSLDNQKTYYFGCHAAGATNAYTVLAPSIVTGVDDGHGNLPNAYDLAQNYPNPFNPTTTISFSLQRACRADIKVYNILGQCVRTIADGAFEAGRHDVEWDGRDERGRTLSSGVYVYRLRTADFTASRKMLRIK